MHFVNQQRQAVQISFSHVMNNFACAAKCHNQTNNINNSDNSVILWSNCTIMPYSHFLIIFTFGKYKIWKALEYLDRKYLRSEQYPSWAYYHHQSILASGKENRKTCWIPICHKNTLIREQFSCRSEIWVVYCTGTLRWSMI